MKNIFISFILILLLPVSSLFAQQTSKTVNLEDYRKLMSSKASIQLIDVRTPGEFNEGHLKLADNIDYNDNKFERNIVLLDKSKPTFIYCLSGGRSGSALNKMKDLGFKEVYNLQGGILAWRDAGLPLTTAETTSRTTVNAVGMSVSDFEKATNGPLPVLVDFSATWCRPCKELKPIIEEIEAENKGKLKVMYIDVDEHKTLADDLKINAIPLIHYYEKGKLIRKKTGLIDKKSLQKLIK